MKRQIKPYTVQEKAELLKSDAIEKIANSSVTYSKEFKVFAVGEYLSGKSPLQITLCTDITYLYYGKCEKAYLSAVKDIATGEIVAYKITRHLTMPIVLDTINNLKNVINLDKVLIHSDQGFHYTNPEYRLLLKKNNVIQSMSRKGNCINNAPMESFFGHFKDEVDYKSCKTFKELVEKIDEYMYYYNNERYQWSKLKMAPVQYRNHLLKVA